MKKNISVKNHEFISLIIPAYKQEKSIRNDLKRIIRVMDKSKRKYEVIVVVDGFLDHTLQKAKAVVSRKIKVVGYKHNHGKGYAVRFGMAKSKGTITAFLDAGMDLHPKSLEVLLAIMQEKNSDIVIGSKLHPLSKVNYPWQRKILSWGYRKVVKMLFGLSISDTQVGLKLFRREVLEDVLPRLLVKRFAFDIEILAVANHMGYKKIDEAPIELEFGVWSSVTSKNFWIIVYRMLWDTAAVFYRLKLLHYYDNRSKRKWKYDPELNFRVNI